MFQIRRAADRDQRSHGWHEFLLLSWGVRPERAAGVRRVARTERECIAPTRGYGMRPYRDAEIVTYVLDGALAHRDNLGNGRSSVRAACSA